MTQRVATGLQNPLGLFGRWAGSLFRNAPNVTRFGLWVMWWIGRATWAFEFQLLLLCGGRVVDVIDWCKENASEPREKPIKSATNNSALPLPFSAFHRLSMVLIRTSEYIYYATSGDILWLLINPSVCLSFTHTHARTHASTHARIFQSYNIYFQ